MQSINLFGNYLGRDDGVTPNRSTYLFVLIARYRKQGHSYQAALELARAAIRE